MACVCVGTFTNLTVTFITLQVEGFLSVGHVTVRVLPFARRENADLCVGPCGYLSNNSLGIFFYGEVLRNVCQVLSASDV